VPSQTVPALITVAIIAVIFALMVRSWRLRAKKHAHLGEMPPVINNLIAIDQFTGLYLATTPTGSPLERITVGGLGFRARTTLMVATEGMYFEIPGDSSKFIPADLIRSVGSASWTIDRGMSPDGLSVISWTLGDTDVDSYFRLDDPAGFLVAAEHVEKTGTQK
jgi:hypothetical protein